MISPLCACALPLKCSHSSVSKHAGMLPENRRRSTCQSTVPRLPCTQPPKILVIAANQRSVPTAVCGEMPNSITMIGVISAPPPTPVRPTSVPTPKPAIALIQSSVTRDSIIEEIGRAHVCTTVTNAHLVCRLLLEKKKDYKKNS